jgi:hypothetical protein
VGLSDARDAETQAADLTRGRILLQEIAAQTSALRSEVLGAESPSAVQVRYDDDDVLAAVLIDDEARRQLTSEQLVEQIDWSLASGPTPRQTLRLPQSLDELLTDPPEVQHHSAPDGDLTIATVAGKPLAVIASPSTILSTPSNELGATIVELSREAAKKEAESDRHL